MTSLRRAALLCALLVFAVPACRGDTTVSAPAPPDLQARLLTVGDLPAGWAPDFSPPPAKGQEPACFGQAQANLRSRTTAQARFVSSEYLPTFVESLSYFGAAPAASAALARAVGAMTSCGRLSFRSDSTSFTGAIGPAVTAGIGSDARAWRIALQGSDGSVVGVYLVLARHGAIVLLGIVGDARKQVRPALLALPTMAYFKIT